MAEVTITAKMDERLAAAERVCLLFGWISPDPEGETDEDALMQAWVEWADLAVANDGNYLTKSRHPELTKDISVLAERRREVRKQILDGIRAGKI